MKTPATSVLRIGSLSFLWTPRSLTVCILLAATALVLGILLMGKGTIPFTPMEVINSLTGWGDNPRADRVILRIRLPRLLTALLVGSSLGMAGTIFQSITRNPLGSPDVIGFTTGAATGAIIHIILFNASPLGTTLAAVLSGMLTAAVAFLLTRKNRSTSGYRLILVGIGIGATLSGVNTVLLVMGDLDQALSAQIWLAGSLNTRTWSHVIPAATGLILILPIALYHSRDLSLLEMGNEMAKQFGVPVERTRLVMVMTAVGLTAIAISAAGPIAFIALAAPQLAKRLTLSPQVPILSGAFMGTVLLLAADLLSQSLPVNLNLPIGLTTGLLGSLYLLWLLARSARI